MTLLFNDPKRRARWVEAEQGTSQFIPYACHITGETLLTKSGELVQILRLQGFPFQNNDSDVLDLQKRLRNTLLKSIAGQDIAIWFHTVRRRLPVYPAGSFLPGFSASLNERWKKRHERAPLYQNSLYISLIKRATPVQPLQLRALWATLSRPNALNRALLNDDVTALSDVALRFQETLSDYGPHRLSIVTSETRVFSEPLSFLGGLINLEERPLAQPTMDVSHYLPYKRLFFGQNAVECRGAQGSRFAAIVSIKEYCPMTSAGMLDSLMNLPMEFVLTQSFTFRHRHDAVMQLQQQQRRLEQSNDLAISQSEDIDEALDQAAGGAIAFGEHHFTIQPIVDQLKDLDSAVAQIDNELLKAGILGVREDLNMEPGFWAQLPGNFKYVARRATLHTLNVAGLASLHNFPAGRPDNNHWGPAVTLLETPGETPYFFNFHARDVGHTLVVGPTGSGKTALVNFLCAQATKFNGRLFYFDRDRGSDIFIRALGGSYTLLGAARESGFNPLQLPDSTTNRTFLVDWISALLAQPNKPLDAQTSARIVEAVQGVYKLAPENRSLQHIASFLGAAGPDTLADRLSLWYGQGAKKQFFGGHSDTLSLNPRVMGFDMTEILKDGTALAPVLLYLFHRIAAVLDGTPTLIVLDEAWALFQNPVFAAKIEDWLKTFRKLNAVLVFATQSVEDAVTSPISATLVGQTATHIFFAHPKATDVYQSVFRLNDREMRWIRQDLNPAERFFLLKQGPESLIARANLSGMPDLISVLSGRVDGIRRAQDLIATYGESPSSWLPHYLEVSHASA